MESNMNSTSVCIYHHLKIGHYVTAYHAIPHSHGSGLTHTRTVNTVVVKTVVGKEGEAQNDAVLLRHIEVAGETDVIRNDSSEELRCIGRETFGYVFDSEYQRSIADGEITLQSC